MNVIMNPPYDGSLHLKILNNVIKTFPKAKIVSLQPDLTLVYKCQLKSYLYAKTFLDGHIKNIYKLPYSTSDEMFNIGNAIGGLSIYYICPSGHKNLDDFTFENNIQKSLYNKVLCKRDHKLSWENIHTKRRAAQNDYEVDLYTWHSGDNAYKTCIREDGKSNRCVIFNNIEQVKNFKKSFSTRFMEWYIEKIIKVGNGIVDKCFMLDDYNHEWTDEMLYKFFELTEDEIKEIEKEIKTYNISNI